MSYKRKNPKIKPMIFFSLTGICLVLLILAGVNLFNNDLIVFSPTEESTFEITESGDYYVMVDTNGIRYQTDLQAVGVTNQLELQNKEDEKVFASSLLLRADTDTGATQMENIEFDKQIRHKEYLSFGRVTLKKDSYTFNGVVITDNEDFGSYALLPVSYVNKIGLFSLSAITTVLFGLLGFKYIREVKKIPMSKYQRKHRVK